MSDSQSNPLNPEAEWSGLLTPSNSAIVMLDHQAAVALPVRSISRQALALNSAALAKTARIFDVPLVLSAIRPETAGELFPEILAAAGTDSPVVERPARRNAWADPEFVRAVKATARRKLVMAGLWTEVALTLTAVSALEAGHEVYVVVDASGGTSREVHDTAIRRMVQAGVVPVTWLQVACECLDAVDTPETRIAVHAINEAHAGALGILWDVDE